MSIVHLRQINAHMEDYYKDLIDLSDIDDKKHGNDVIDQHFRTRALAAYAIKSLAEVGYDVSADCVTDGYGDNGVDAIFFSKSDRVIYLIQSKWSQDGSGSISVGDAQKFQQGFRDLINARFERFNTKVKNKQSELDEALNDANTRIVMAVVYTGTQPVSDGVKNIISDLTSEINDTSEVLVFKILRQSNIYNSIARGADSQPIDVELALHSWGQVREPYQAYYGQVSAVEVAGWWNEHFPHIFSPNIRVYLGNTDINDSMIDSVINSPEKFWYFNNGITALCANLSKKPIGGAGRDMGVFECNDFRIVNGAQTVGSIAAAADKNPEQIEHAKVPIRVISLANTPDDFGKDITKNNNTQNRIDRRDFVALDENQERIKSELVLDGVSYVYKSGESIPPGEDGFDLVEATITLACGSDNITYAVQAKREIGRLWDDITKAPYRALFNDGLAGPKLWRMILVMRELDKFLVRKSKNEEGRRRLCAIHGNRLVSFIAFSGLDDNVVDGFGKLEDSERSDIEDVVNKVYESVFASIEHNYPDSYPASLFKNVSKCQHIYSLM